MKNTRVNGYLMYLANLYFDLTMQFFVRTTNYDNLKCVAWETLHFSYFIVSRQYYQGMILCLHTLASFNRFILHLLPHP